MRNLLQQLENNEGILQMYLADELDEQDRQEVAQLLEGDKGLAEQLRTMQADRAAVMGALAALDAGPADAGAEAHRLREVSRLIKRWHLEQLSRPPVVTPRRSMSIPKWTYPAAAAALVCVALGWWGMAPDNSMRVASDTHDDTVVVKPDAPAPDVPPQVAMDLSSTTSATSLGSVWPLTQPGEAAAEDPEMSEAQQQASALVRRSNDAALTASIFMTDTND